MFTGIPTRMLNRKLVSRLMVFAFVLILFWAGPPVGSMSAGGKSSQESPKSDDRVKAPGATWTFAGSGVSRNCGDVVMPETAAGAQAHDAAFYWHLGDFRLGSDVDQDMTNDEGDRG